MKVIWKAIVAILLVVGLIAGAVLIMAPGEPPSQKLLLTASELPEEGWHQNSIGKALGLGIPVEDASESVMEKSNISNHQLLAHALIIVDIYHFNSTGSARAYCEGLLSNQATWNISVEKLAMGDEAFLEKNAGAVTDDNHCQVFILKGSYAVWMTFGWTDSYGWTYSEIEQIAQLQADKMK